MKDIGIVEVIGQNAYCSRSGENIIDLRYQRRSETGRLSLVEDHARFPP